MRPDLHLKEEAIKEKDRLKNPGLISLEGVENPAGEGTKGDRTRVVGIRGEGVVLVVVRVEGVIQGTGLTVEGLLYTHEDQIAEVATSQEMAVVKRGLGEMLTQMVEVVISQETVDLIEDQLIPETEEGMQEVEEKEDHHSEIGQEMVGDGLPKQKLIQKEAI